MTYDSILMLSLAMPSSIFLGGVLGSYDEDNCYGYCAWLLKCCRSCSNVLRHVYFDPFEDLPFAFRCKKYGLRLSSILGAPSEVLRHFPLSNKLGKETLCAAV